MLALLLVGPMGTKSQKPTDYDSLLDDASEMPVILYDTFLKRARQNDAENLILHMILHRQRKGRSAANMPDLADEVNGALPDRRQMSTREAMKANSDRVISFRSQLEQPGSKAILFKHKVERLYTDLDALWERTLPQNINPNLFRLGSTKHQIHGWEYKSLVSGPKYLTPKLADLGRSNDGWHQYAQDLRALNLFGSDMGDFFYLKSQQAFAEPARSSPRETTRYQSELMLYKGSSNSKEVIRTTRALLTMEGIYIYIYGNDCHGNREVDLVQRPTKEKFQFLHQLPKNGVFVIRAKGPGLDKKIPDWFSFLKLKPRSSNNVPPYFTVQGLRSSSK